MWIEEALRDRVQLCSSETDDFGNLRYCFSDGGWCVLLSYNDKAGV